MRLLDKYFRRPVFWDYLIIISIALAIYVAVDRKYLMVPNQELVMSMTSDLSTVGLTCTGFILTLFTILITLKGGVKYNQQNKSILDKLLSTDELFGLTIFHLKNCIKSLLFISVLGYALRIIFQESSILTLFIYNCVALTILTITLWRCLLILTKIVGTPQKKEEKDNW